MNNKSNFLLSLTAEEYLVHESWMAKARSLAKQAGKAGDVPVGAIVVDSQGNAIAQGNNSKERNQDPTAHAEIIALRAASQVKQNWHLNRQSARTLSLRDSKAELGRKRSQF